MECPHTRVKKNVLDLSITKCPDLKKMPSEKHFWDGTCSNIAFDDIQFLKPYILLHTFMFKYQNLMI